jgi:hypothetical protein
VRSAEAPAFFCRPMLCRAVPKLIGPFYFYQFRCRDSARLCWPSDGRAASFDPILSVDPSPSLPSLLYTLPNSFRHCQSVPLASSSRFSAVLYSHAEHPVSEYVVSCEKIPFRLFPCPSTLSLHTISLIHRRLTLCHP